MGAGRRDSLIIVERFEEVGRNDLNEPIKEWAAYTKEWAAVYFGNGAEQRQAAQTEGTQAATFEVLANAKTRAITIGDRVNFDGGAWDIRSTAPIGRTEIKINAVRRLS